MIIIIAVVVLVGGLGAVKFLKPAKKSGKHEKKHIELSLWKMEEFTVNLADRDEPHYLKVNIVAEIEGKLEAEKGGHGGGEGEANPVQIKASDAVISVLCKKYFAELLTEKGKDQLKSDLIKELNKSVPGVKVANVYFTSFAMQ
jgi:flagellar basal body-associated protein FliL